MSSYLGSKKIKQIFLTDSQGSIKRVLKLALGDKIGFSDWLLEYDSSSSSYTITGHSNPVGDLVIPSYEVTDGKHGYHLITKIGWRAFYGYHNLTSITIPDNVTSMESEAFSNCSGLTSVTIGNNVTTISYRMFHYCSSLTSITIPDGVTSIGNSAFSYCSSLTSITIPNSVTSIGHDAFYDCSSLTSVTIPDSVKSIGDYVFYNCNELTSVTIGNSVTSIGNYAFTACTNLTSITIPDSVTSIGERAFIDCSGLTNITLPGSVTSIGRSAFYNCSALTKISSTTTQLSHIEPYLCYNCTNLTSFNLIDKNNITLIGQSAFENCSSLNLTLPAKSTLTKIETKAFKNSKIKKVTFHSNTIMIGSSAFENCTNLGEIYFSNNDNVSYGSNLFAGCTAVSSMEVYFNDDSSAGNYTLSTLFGGAVGESAAIPTTLKSIKILSPIVTAYALAGCSMLTSISLVNTTTIHREAFSLCSGISSLTIPTTVTYIGLTILDRCAGLTELDLPFLGTDKTDPMVFGNLFGNGSIEGMVACYQWISSSGSYYCYVPSNFNKITIQAGTLCYGALSNLKSLTEAVIKDDVIFIDFGVFYGCENLHKLKIPFVGRSKDFLYATNEKTVKYPFGCIFSNPYQSSGAFQNSLSINQCSLFKNNTTSSYSYSSEYTYYIPADLEEVIVQNNKFNVVIHGHCFENCYNPDVEGRLNAGRMLATVKLFGNIHTIEEKAFYNCRGIHNLSIPNITTISESAFENTGNLSNIYSVSFRNTNSNITIGKRAFYGAGLYDVIFPDLNSSYSITIGESAFENAFVSSVRGIALKKCITSIGSNAFKNSYGCLYLENGSSITNTNSLYAITNRPVFKYCYFSDGKLTYFTKHDSSIIGDLSSANTENQSTYYPPGWLLFTGWLLNNSGTDYITMSTIKSAANGNYYPYYESSGCVSPDSLITLKDLSKKKICDLKETDELLTWNFDEGKFDSASILFIDKEDKKLNDVYYLTFSDNKLTKVIYEHGFFDKTLNKFVYLRDDANEYIGHEFLKYKQDKNNKLTYEIVTLDKVEIKQELIDAWSAVTCKDLGYFINDMLTMPGGIPGLFNIFDVDSNTLKYTDNKNDDLNKYGIFTYEEFNNQYPISKEAFEALNGMYLKVALGKNLITEDFIKYLYNRYSPLFSKADEKNELN